MWTSGFGYRDINADVCVSMNIVDMYLHNKYT